MTFPPWPFSRVSAPLAPLSAAVVAVALLLGLPASSFARADLRAAGPQTEQGESSETALKSAGLLARGSGYASQAGSKAVRELQLRLRRIGHGPGPVDGLFGPLTEASVERFQRTRGLRVDGVVGPRTRARLLAVSVRRPAAPHGSVTPKPGAPDRLAPNRPPPADVAAPRHPAPNAVPERPAAREPGSSDGLEPWLAALLGALAAGALFAGLSMLGRRRREPASERRGPAPQSTRGRLNLGMAFALLLAVFATGAAIGALFATHAAPGDRGAEVASGALLAPQAAPPAQELRLAKPRHKSRPAVAARSQPRSPRSGATAPSPTPTPRPAAGERPEPGSGPGTGLPGAGSAPSATPPAPPVAPVEPPVGSYTMQPGDSLSPVTREQPEAGSSSDATAARLKRLIGVDLEDRFASGDPDLLTAGEQLKRP